MTRMSDKIMSVQEFDARHEQIISKYGFIASEADRDGVRFVRPTDSPLLRSNVLRNQDSSMRLRGRSFSTFFLNREAAKVLQSLESPSRDDIAQHRDTQRQYQAASRQTQYEHELHQMVCILRNCREKFSREKDDSNFLSVGNTDCDRSGTKRPECAQATSCSFGLERSTAKSEERYFFRLNFPPNYIFLISCSKNRLAT